MAGLFAAANMPSLISAAGNLLSGGLGSLFGSSANRQNIELARENRAWQEQENQKQRDFTKTMWELQNEYNTPAHQRKLAQEAGYNPYILGDSYGVGQAGSPGSPSMSGSPDSARVSPVNPLSGIGSASDSAARFLELANQGEQIKSNIDQQKMQTLDTLSDIMIKLYKEGGQDQLDDFFKKFSPLLDSLNFSGSRSEIRFEKEMKMLDSERYNKDMDSLLKDFEYETSKEWTPKEKAQRFEFVSNQNKNLIQDLALKAMQEKLTSEEARRVASEIARNFAEAFNAHKQGEYYEVSAGQMTIINGMLALQFEDALADFDWKAGIRRYKHQFGSRETATNLFLGSLGVEATTQDIGKNKFIQYGKEVTNMVGNVFKVNLGFSNSHTHFRNYTPQKNGQFFYSGDGYYLNNGVLQKGNW